MLKNFFNFENNKKDFPFYDNNPLIYPSDWALILFSAVMGYLLYMSISERSQIFAGIVFCLTMLIPLLYVSNWNYELIFHKPDKQEIILALLLFAGYVIYTIILTNPFSGPQTGAHMTVTYEILISFIFTMMGEELFKFIPLMFFMRVFYKHTNNRKASIAASVIIVLFIFALLHFDGSILSVILFQGIGSMFEMYGYLKTKNLLIPYITHLLIDVTLMVLPLIIHI